MNSIENLLIEIFSFIKRFSRTFSIIIFAPKKLIEQTRTEDQKKLTEATSFSLISFFIFFSILNSAIYSSGYYGDQFSDLRFFYDEYSLLQKLLMIMPLFIILVSFAWLYSLINVKLIRLQVRKIFLYFSSGLLLVFSLFALLTSVILGLLPVLIPGYESDFNEDLAYAIFVICIIGLPVLTSILHSIILFRDKALRFVGKRWQYGVIPLVLLLPLYLILYTLVNGYDYFYYKINTSRIIVSSINDKTEISLEIVYDTCSSKIPGMYRGLGSAISDGPFNVRSEILVTNNSSKESIIDYDRFKLNIFKKDTNLMELRPSSLYKSKLPDIIKPNEMIILEMVGYIDTAYFKTVQNFHGPYQIQGSLLPYLSDYSNTIERSVYISTQVACYHP